MLATAGAVPAGPGWSAEIKWDGARLVTSASGTRLRAITRAGRDATAAFPEIATLTDLLDGRAATVDGELVALDASGRPNFGLLQRPTRRP